ncbi:MAG: hypothetical protein Q9181_001201 [Wetmoreana brouardii]
MNVQLYRGEGALIVGREDTGLESRFHHLGLEGGAGTWITQVQRSPLPSPYSVPSPIASEALTPNFLNAQHSPALLGSTSPSYTVQTSGNGSLFSPSFPAFGMQTPAWNGLAAPLGPGTMGQVQHSPLLPFGAYRNYPRGFVRQGGRHIQDYSGGHHNVVDVGRIRKGADVRTTVCCEPNIYDGF